MYSLTQHTLVEQIALLHSPVKATEEPTWQISQAESNSNLVKLNIYLT